MKPIIFRGNRIDNGEGVEGCYVKIEGRSFIIIPEGQFDYEDDADGNQNIIIYDGVVEVNPDTVGLRPPF